VVVVIQDVDDRFSTLMIGLAITSILHDINKNEYIMICKVHK
jgi:hypothetical protein